MTAQAEHAKAPGVVRVVELVGVSDKGWSDAARQAVARANETLRHITGIDVIHSTAVVRDGKIAEYHADLKVAFIIEPAEIEGLVLGT
jgi:flavin-binding protein dodecin